MKDLLEGISDDLMLLRPMWYKTLMKGSPKESGKRASYLEAPILGMLMSCGAKPISVIGKRLYISKPNMTGIVDKLIAEGKVERIPDNSDRRVTMVSITPKGESYMKEHRITIKGNIKRNLSCLSQADLRRIYESLETMKDIVAKISKEA